MSSFHSRSKYDTQIVYLYFHHKEYLLSESLRKSIPASTISTWRKNDPSCSYIGYAFREQHDYALKQIELSINYQKLEKR